MQVGAERMDAVATLVRAREGGIRNCCAITHNFVKVVDMQGTLPPK